MENQPDITIVEDETDNLLAKMAVHKLDLVIADTPLPPHISFSAEEKLLGTSPMAIYASDPLAQDLQENFPRSLHGAPFLAPTDSSALGREVGSWLRQHELQPRIVGRFENSSLLKYFATNGHGCFAAPLSLSEYLATSHYVLPIGELTGLTVSYYALHNIRRLKHAGIETIIAAGQRISGLNPATPAKTR